MSCILDLDVRLENGSFITDLHTNITDCHQYLHCSSSHPDHIKNFIFHNQTFRLNNIYTKRTYDFIYEDDFDKHVLNTKS